VAWYCAGCGCLVDHATRIVPCDTRDCCCLELPIRLRTVEEIAAGLGTAFAARDLDLFGSLLAVDVSWGDDDHPNRCRSRSDVVGTFGRLLTEGVEGTVTESVVRPNGVAVKLHVEWPNPGEGRGANFWHSYIVSDGRVTEIQRHDGRRSAIAAVSR
jgi:hypothetical protein